MKKSEIYIYHHLGLGDHIICNGLVRFYRKNYDIVCVFCKPNNYDNVTHMYRDDKNIKILPIGEDYDVENYILKNKLNDNVVKVGFNKLRNCKNDTFDQCFYTTLGLEFDMRFNHFFLKRDIDIENDIYDDLNPENAPYIFIHGDVDKKKIRNDLKIIENPTKYNLFHIGTLLERAEEVHLMESSIKCLANSIKMTHPRFYYHQYIRKYSDYFNSKGINNFEVIL